MAVDYDLRPFRGLADTAEDAAAERERPRRRCPTGVVSCAHAPCADECPTSPAALVWLDRDTDEPRAVRGGGVYLSPAAAARLAAYCRAAMEWRADGCGNDPGRWAEVAGHRGGALEHVAETLENP